MNDVFLAIDIGASSGRHIIGTVNDHTIQLKEIHRFENRLITINNHKCWDIKNLTNQIIIGLKKVKAEGYEPRTMGIDTWGCDFVLLDQNNQVISDAVSYRDNRTDGIRDELEHKGIITFEQCYQRSGIQYQKFNTLYQLYALQKEHPEQIERAKTFLMIPDYLNYVLTGKLTNEYTNATTTGLVNATTKQWDQELIQKLNLKEEMFLPLQMPGASIGTLTDKIQRETGINTEVILPATHDTGSAYISVPVIDTTSIFLSSGTWSLMGTENTNVITTKESREANFTNEGGYDHTYRYLKNIMGLWMIQNVRKEEGQKRKEIPSFPQLIKEAEQYKNINAVINVDDPIFLCPDSMEQAVIQACDSKGIHIPNTAGAILQVIYNSLADDYSRTIKILEHLTNKTYTDIHIVGGGCQDQYLNQTMADKTKLPVYAGPTEGTALGNLLVQMIRVGIFKDLKEGRKAVKNSFHIETFLPQ